MNHRIAIPTLTLVAMLVPGLLLGAPPEEVVEMQEDAELEAWIDSLDEPGPNHRVLDAIVGTWEGTGKVWDTIDSEPVPIKATIERTWVLGGRFIQEVVQVRTPGEEIYEALGFIGFNNGSGQYELLNIDRASTAMLLETGKFNPDTKKLVIRGSFRDPATGFVIDRQVVMDLSQDGRIEVVGHVTNEEGREYKFLEGTVTRRKQ